MAKAKTNFTELIHQAVREAGGPLTIDEIVARVLELSGGDTTKNLKNTVRSAITSSVAIVATPGGRYGWKSQVLNGAVQRVVLHDEDLARRELILDDLQRDLLQPNGFGSSKYGVVGPPRLELSGGPTVEAAVVHREYGEYLLEGDERFWGWVEGRGLQPGDSLLLTAIDVDARRYSLTYEPALARDEQAIAARSQELIDAAVAFVRRHSRSATVFELAGHLNASGVLHKAPAPEPFGDLWTPAVWGPLAEEYDLSPFLLSGRRRGQNDILAMLLGGGLLEQEIGPAGTGEGPVITVGEHGSYQGDLGVDPGLLQARIDAILEDPNTPILEDDPLLPAITTVFSALSLPSPSGQPYLASALVQQFGDSDEILDWIEHGAELGMVQIDPAYEAMFDDGPEGGWELPGPEERAEPSRTLVLRVSYRARPEFWREIEIADDQRLSDLHLAIQRALEWDNDHLYSFYTGRRPYDPKTEIGSPGSDARRRADRVTIGELGLRTKQKLLYLFDFGDSHLFDIQVMKINPKAPPGAYPRVVGQQGESLPQYEGEEEWGAWDDWEDEE